MEKSQSQEKEDERVFRSACRMCHGGCGVLIHVKNDKIIKIEGDPESPLSKGTLCIKALAGIDLVYHPPQISSEEGGRKRGGQVAADQLG